MRRARLLAVTTRASFISALAIGLALAFGLASSDASGQKADAPAAKAPAKPAPKSAADGGERNDPDNITAISEFMETAIKGMEKYAAKDFVGAVDIFKKAIQMSPRNALGPYLLGEAYLALNNLGEAEAAFKSAEELNDPKFPLVRSHVLFSVADCFERQKKWEQARVAWQAYTEHASKLGVEAGAHPASGVARLKAVDDWLKLDKAYAVVRQRIADDKPDAGADAGKPAPKK